MPNLEDRVTQLENTVNSLARAQLKQRPRRLWPWITVLVFAAIVFYGLPLLMQAVTVKFASIGASIQTTN